MKRWQPYTAQEEKEITLGLISIWGSVALFVLAPALTAVFCNRAGASPEIMTMALCLSSGAAIILIGLYHIIGTLIGARHLLAALRHDYRYPNKTDLRSPWTKKEKAQYVVIGALFVLLGVAFFIFAFAA